MADTFLAKRSLSVLKPIDLIGEEVIQHITPDEIVKAEITRPRNILHHRKFFALLNAIYPHQDLYPTMASFRAAVTCALGFGETVKLGNGKVVLIPHSISFAKLDQAGFEEFYDRAVALIVTRILPNVQRADVEREVAEILAGRNGVPDYALVDAR